jgi:hypothetical protein
MKSKRFWSVLGILAVLAAAFTIRALAQTQPPVHLSGLINDYAPEGNSTTSQWEIRGEWNMTMQGASGTANFSAALTMERSDYWLTLNPGSVLTPGDRSPHTHHITMVNAAVIPLPNGGFSITGPVSVTGNGNPALAGSTLEVDITGGSSVPYSNITLTFGGAAATHFGSQKVHGVVGVN